ncbi:MAG: GNAT family N-acetyltransferase [Cytophagales bacterium]
MEVKHQDLGNKGSFYIGEENDKKGEMTYSKAGDQMIIIDHTEVSEELKGKGAGKQMLMKAVEMARNKNLKILPLCPFAKSVFDKDQSISDVLS